MSHVGPFTHQLLSLLLLLSLSRTHPSDRWMIIFIPSIYRDVLASPRLQEIPASTQLWPKGETRIPAHFDSNLVDDWSWQLFDRLITVTRASWSTDIQLHRMASIRQPTSHPEPAKWTREKEARTLCNVPLNREWWNISAHSFHHVTWINQQVMDTWVAWASEMCSIHNSCLLGLLEMHWTARSRLESPGPRVKVVNKKKIEFTARERMCSFLKAMVPVERRKLLPGRRRKKKKKKKKKKTVRWWIFSASRDKL